MGPQLSEVLIHVVLTFETFSQQAYSEYITKNDSISKKWNRLLNNGMCVGLSGRHDIRKN